jgi:RNA polymerase sigma factor (sigma-70 family)
MVVNSSLTSSPTPRQTGCSIGRSDLAEGSKIATPQAQIGVLTPSRPSLTSNTLRVPPGSDRLRLSHTNDELGPHGLGKDAFEAALAEQPKLRQALIARYGLDLGEQAVAAAMAWAWEHRDRLVGMTGLRAYLFRVAQSSMRRSWVWSKRNSAMFPPERAEVDSGSIDEALDLANLLRKLPQKQRTCVLLVHAHGWSYRDVAELLGVSTDAVNNHTHRGMTTLRKLTQITNQEDQS